MTRLKNLIQPILVKKSYLYLGIPPLIKISNAMSKINFNAILNDAKDTYCIKILGIKNLINSSIFWLI
jgi:DNA gyrase/topoisomerase IV subunit B